MTSGRADESAGSLTETTDRGGPNTGNNSTPPAVTRNHRVPKITTEGDDARRTELSPSFAHDRYARLAVQ